MDTRRTGAAQRKASWWLPITGVLAAVVAAVVVLVVLFTGTGDDEEPAGQIALTPRYEPGIAVPAAAADTATTLVTGDPGAQRAVLTPELAELLPEGRLFPGNARLVLHDGSWHEGNGYANAMGTVSVRGQPDRTVLFAFAQRDGEWRITLAEVVS
ncbi:hypothetical protein ABZ639_05790 [Saccharomonospora sp. NPDC006951]